MKPIWTRNLSCPYRVKMDKYEDLLLTIKETWSLINGSVIDVLKTYIQDEADKFISHFRSVTTPDHWN